MKTHLGLDGFCSQVAAFNDSNEGRALAALVALAQHPEHLADLPASAKGDARAAVRALAAEHGWPDA